MTELAVVSDEQADRQDKRAHEHESCCPGAPNPSMNQTAGR